MKKFNLLLTTSTLALLATGCVKPAQNTEAIYNEPAQVSNQVNQPIVYDEPQTTVYNPTSNNTVYTPSSNTVYEDTPVITTTNTTGEVVGGTVYSDPYATQNTTTTTSYPDPYATQNTTTTTSYPDPYATQNTTTTTSYPDPYANQSVISDYPATNSYPTTTSSSSVSGGGIQLQIAALKDYAAAKDYKNRLSLAPGLSAYIVRGSMNKVIVSGIPSVSEANRLKQSRFPGAFLYHGNASSGYTPPVQPNYDTSVGTYNVNNPYGVSSSSVSGSGIGVQVGAFSSRSKAQSVANNQGGQYPATVKKIGRYYKVILTGFSSRSAAKAHAGRVGGFVVNY